MNEKHLYGAKQIYPKLDNAVQFRLCGVKELFHCINQLRRKHEYST